MNPTSLARKCLIDCEGDREKAVAAMHAALTPEMTSDLVAAGKRKG